MSLRLPLSPDEHEPVAGTRDFSSIKRFLENGVAKEAVHFDSTEDRHAFVRATLARFGYEYLSREEKGLVRRYLQAATGYSRAQVERLVRQYRDVGNDIVLEHRIRAERSQRISAQIVRSLRSRSVILTGLLLIALTSLVGSEEQASLLFLNGGLPESGVSFQPAVESGFLTGRGLLAYSRKPTAVTFLSVLPSSLGIRSEPLLTESEEAIKLPSGNVIFRRRLWARRQERMRASNVVLAESMKSAAQNPVTVTNVLASGIQRMIDAFGPGSDGQILMFERGKAVWRNVPMPVVVRGDGSGGGRKPPEERGDDERRFGGGGGNTATNDGLIETHDHQSDPGGGIIDVNAATRGILAVSRGGTGNASYSTGDLLVGTAVGGLSKLAKGSNSQVLTVSNGTLAWAASAGGGGGSSDTGALMSVFDRRYVNESGDTMTGSLILSGANVGLTASGQIKAGGAIYGSGVLVVAGTGSTKAAFIINSDGSVGDALLVFGSDGTNETLKFLNNEDRFELSDDLNVTGGLYASGALIIGGAGSVKGDFTVNSDQTAADTVLTFGSDSTNETLKFLNNEDRFEFSDDVNVTGGLYATGALIIGGAG
ncbi:MAG: hypothetical protein AAB489_05615, partial [Patescibacteria group bacterium]